MRTDEEILKKIKQIEADDFFGFKISDLMSYLSYDSAKQYLKEDVTEEKWNDLRSKKDSESLKKKMKNYMNFAWEKANGGRGISAARTMDHYSIWLWMLGDKVSEKFGNLSNHKYYGKDNLCAICDYLSIDANIYDDGIREN